PHHVPSYSSATHPPPPDIHTLSLHDALPILSPALSVANAAGEPIPLPRTEATGESTSRSSSGHAWKASRRSIHSTFAPQDGQNRSEEHTSELQSLRHLVCRLLLEKKKQKKIE